MRRRTNMMATEHEKLDYGGEPLTTTSMPTMSTLLFRCHWHRCCVDGATYGYRRQKNYIIQIMKIHSSSWCVEQVDKATAPADWLPPALGTILSSRESVMHFYLSFAFTLFPLQYSRPTLSLSHTPTFECRQINSFDKLSSPSSSCPPSSGCECHSLLRPLTLSLPTSVFILHFPASAHSDASDRIIHYTHNTQIINSQRRERRPSGELLDWIEFSDEKLLVHAIRRNIRLLFTSSPIGIVTIWPNWIRSNGQ